MKVRRKMSVKILGDAVTRYQNILETESFRDLAWADELTKKMEEQRLVIAGRPVSPFLRPHFITRKQYDHMVTASESLTAAIDRVKRLALATPQLLSRMSLLPAEKMLAQIDPGYSYLAVTSLLDTHLQNGHLHFNQYSAETPSGVAYGELLADLFYEAAPVKEFRKKHKLGKVGGTKFLLQAILRAYKEYGGKKKPNIAILEFRQPFANFESGEYQLLAELFRKQGYNTEVISLEQLEYKNGVLRRGDFEIDLVYRRVRISEFLARFDLNHALLRAYRERNVCLVNNFRGEVAQKKAIFDLLTDETVTANFPLIERKAIREYIPWTRVVGHAKSSYHGKPIDLPEFVMSNRERLILRPNDQTSDLPEVRGWEVDHAQWERAVRRATANAYVVQERVESVHAPFPVRTYAGLDYRDMNIEVHPHSFLGKVHGCTTWLSTPSANGFSTASGLAPTFVLEGK